MRSICGADWGGERIVSSWGDFDVIFAGNNGGKWAWEAFCYETDIGGVALLAKDAGSIRKSIPDWGLEVIQHIIQLQFQFRIRTCQRSLRL